MKSRILLPAVAVVAVAGAFFAWRENAPPAKGEAPRAGASAQAAVASSSGAVGSIAAGPAPISPGRTSAIRATPVKHSLTAELASARTYKALYDRLAGSAEGQTADGQYALYKILRACATVGDKKGAAARNNPEFQQQHRDYVASLPDSDPTKSRRLVALDKLGEDQCVGLNGLATTEAELTKKLSDAAAAGSSAARTLQIEQDMWAERRIAGSNVRGGPTLSDGQMDTLRSALTSQDPEALVNAGRVLAANFRDITVRLGNDTAPIDRNAMMTAFTLAACDYGYPCDDSNTRIVQACAFQGYCEAGNLSDFITYYQSSPYQQQMLAQYQSTLRGAIQTGNSGVLQFQRGTTPPQPFPPGGFRRP
ncbi:hypothetical protein BWI17_10300 [Betaproteobacteria bacterium GR16-43]|nr:hypothetical protein BWI17_10300 [Betaproteobacteria bacterium GR16-43]